MYLKQCVLSIFICFVFSSISAQQTTVFTEANIFYKKGMEYYEDGLFALAKKSFEQAVLQLQPVNEPEARLLTTKAELFVAKCAVRMNLPEGERMILDFARANKPDPIANKAVIEMANYYYNAKKYDKAVQLFAQIDASELSKEERSEVKFKQGYALFVRKKFKQARGAFNLVKDQENQYYYPTNYYLGLCAFFENDYSAAIKSFKRAERSKKYKPHIPYYIAQIYFAQGEYEKVIDYAKPKLKDKSLRKRPEISQLIGQAYFEGGNYRQALPYLEEYAKRSSRLRKEDFYQLGFVQHKSKKYKSAAQNFEQLSKINSKMGQNAMYLLGDCQLRLGSKTKARNAFKAASKLNFDRSIKEESLYNYAKLSYELNYDREAVAALQEIPPTSKYYAESQTIMSAIFLNTRDYEKAMEIIDKLPNKTPQLKETYQKVAFYRGLQLYKAGSNDEAIQLFNKSLSIPVDSRTKALAIYWKGDIAHQQRDYGSSASEMNKFISLAKTLSRLPDESSVHTANYTQGYNYLKQKNYASALGYFQETVAGIKKNTMYISNPYVREDVLGDATLRAGDCLFKRNRYGEAIRFYDDAINNQYNGYVYALYQKAIIEGLQNNTTEKIIALESIVDDYPNSEYADNALLQLGITYQEIGKFDQASRPLKRLVDQYKGRSELYNQALLKLGLISYNQGNLQNAINYYKQIFNNNPEAREAQAA
ncbi:MAG: tetratricopeptide repeat protein, partial [Bacteroidota bacterium]